VFEDTKLEVLLAEFKKGRLVSVDSIQFYHRHCKHF